MCELPLLVKCLVVAGCNFIGVYVVKYIEEKMRKDKLWKVEATVYARNTAALDIALTQCHIPHNYINAGKYSIFNCYCATQDESREVKKALDEIGAKFFVSESKTLA
jgi:dTDP-D-glucose 4,6-dehydratase